MLKLLTKVDLERLVTDRVQESLALDYKDARSLGKTSSERNELCKDVSAFANSAGGQIIYGIEERDRHPVRVQDSDSIDPAAITREWIEQVIDSNIQPRIQNLLIQSIDKFAYPIHRCGVRPRRLRDFDTTVRDQRAAPSS
jgi:schlafen family protein